MIQAFNAAHYRYMDLIETLAAKRLEVAERIDRNELTEDQAKLENAKLYMDYRRVIVPRGNIIASGTAPPFSKTYPSARANSCG